MKILIHSNAPMAPSGYGQQVRLLIPRLRAAGHEVAVSAFYGLGGSPINHNGVPIFPAGRLDFGVDVLIPHALTYQADLIIPLMDFWKLLPIADDLSNMKVAPWLPIDCTPVGRDDQRTLKTSNAIPIAMSRFGMEQLRDIGYSHPLYAPHAFDSKEFYPVPERAELREEVGVSDKFVVGICAANADWMRKGWAEQLRAFARFHRKHKDTILMVHTLMHHSKGLDLATMFHDFGINDAVMVSDQYMQVSGMMSQDMMRSWYGCLDLLSNCSYGEGFGVPIIEAQACGVPVVVSDNSAMTELSGSGWRVKGQEFWNPVHHAWWSRPNADEIVKCYEKAYQEAGGAAAKQRSERAVQFASAYSADQIFAEYWIPVLESLA